MIILLLCLMLAMPVSAEETEVPTEAPSDLCVAKVESFVNIRKEPSAESDAVGKLYRSGVGRILSTEETDEGTWYRVRSGQVVGYISADFLASGDEAEAMLDDAYETIAQVIPADLTVYDEPDSESNMIAVVNESAFLDVLEEQDGWTKIVTPYQVTGWVPSDQISTEEVLNYAETISQEETRLQQESEADETAATESELWKVAEEALQGTEPFRLEVMDALTAQEEARAAFLADGGTAEEAEAIEEEILGPLKEEETEQLIGREPGTEAIDEEFGTEEVGESSTENDNEEPGTEAGTEEADEEATGEQSDAEEIVDEPGTESLIEEPDTEDVTEEDLPDYIRTYREAVNAVYDAQKTVNEEQAKAQVKVDAAQRASITAAAAEKVAVEAARKAPSGAEGSQFETQRDHTIYFPPSLGDELVSYAAQFVGNPYVWGGESLTNGCDCSGFTMLVYAKFGITLPHFAESQAAYGAAVEEEDLQPGDLVFYESNNYIYHVAIYIGNDTIIHAASTRTGIIFSNMRYSSSHRIYRRLLK